MALGLREISGEPVIDSENGEELMRVQPGVDIALSNLPRESPGTLYITTKYMIIIIHSFLLTISSFSCSFLLYYLYWYWSYRQVIWVSDVDKSKGYAVDFLSISLHAVSRDPEAYPTPCLYTQVQYWQRLSTQHWLLMWQKTWRPV